MERIIKSMENKYLVSALELVENVFTKYENEAEGRLVRRLVEEIRAKKYYIPELELIMVNESDEVIGYAMFSCFHIEERYEDELLMLTPVAVKTELQRQHISKELIEYGFAKAKKMGYKVVLVEGNPQNYRSRGFVTSAGYGIFAAPSVGLPAKECLMVKELTEGALENINGSVDYSFYECLRGGNATMEEYKYITLRESPMMKDAAAEWFHSKWGVPKEAYLECMNVYLSNDTEYGWYLCLDGERIVAGMGVIENDFHDRKDLAPNVCAVYTEEEYRGKGIAGTLLNMVVDDMKTKGITPIYLVTDHTGFYERYGWEFLCMVQGDDEPGMTRMYIHR